MRLCSISKFWAFVDHCIVWFGHQDEWCIRHYQIVASGPYKENMNKLKILSDVEKIQETKINNNRKIYCTNSKVDRTNQSHTFCNCVSIFHLSKFDCGLGQAITVLMVYYQLSYSYFWDELERTVIEVIEVCNSIYTQHFAICRLLIESTMV